MAKQRYINTKFWSDNFIVELNPLDRYLFLYLLTNEKTDICGIYELPIRTMAFETGIEKEMLEKMFDRFKGKIYYVEGWVYIKNFAKHQADNASVKMGIKRSMSVVPEEIIEKIKAIDTGWVHPVDTLPTSSGIPRPKPVPRPKPTEYTTDFENFWKIYPKKVGKGKAFEQWEKLTDDEKKKAMEDIPKRKEDEKWVGGFIKDPERYIKYGQWEDDIIKAKAKKGALEVPAGKYEKL